MRVCGAAAVHLVKSNIPIPSTAFKRKGVKNQENGDFLMIVPSFEFHEVKIKKNCYYFSKRKWKYFYTFNHFYSEKSSKRAK